MAPSIVSVTDDKYIVKNGIEVVEYDKCKEDYSKDKLLQGGSFSIKESYQTSDSRRYQILNEVIHDILMKLIVKMANAKGLSFGKTKDDYLSSIYVRAREMVEPFVMANLDKIKECYKSDDPYMFDKMFGKDLGELLDRVSKAVISLSEEEWVKAMSEIETKLGVDSSKVSKASILDKCVWTPKTKKILSYYYEADKAVVDFEKNK